MILPLFHTFLTDSYGPSTAVEVGYKTDLMAEGSRSRTERLKCFFVASYQHRRKPWRRCGLDHTRLEIRHEYERSCGGGDVNGILIDDGYMGAMNGERTARGKY